MKNTVVAAIVGAIDAYIQMEEQVRIMPSKGTLHPGASLWSIFGRQEMMRARTRWQVTRINR